MVKMLCLCKKGAPAPEVLSKCRNSFVNLALPLLSMSEAGPVGRRKVSPVLEVNEWSLLEVEKGTKLTLGALVKQLEKKTGLKVWDIFKEDECLLLQMAF